MRSHCAISGNIVLGQTRPGSCIRPPGGPACTHGRGRALGGGREPVGFGVGEWRMPFELAIHRSEVPNKEGYRSIWLAVLHVNALLLD